MWDAVEDKKRKCYIDRRHTHEHYVPYACEACGMLWRAFTRPPSALGRNFWRAYEACGMLWGAFTRPPSALGRNFWRAYEHARFNRNTIHLNGRNNTLQ